MEKYEFREVIGSGNYGTCHLVMHRKERRPYVAKKIPVHKMAQRGEALAEAQLLSKLRHPNIIAYKESFLEEETESLCIVTAYAEEGDLFTHIRRAREARRHFSETTRGSGGWVRVPGHGARGFARTPRALERRAPRRRSRDAARAVSREVWRVTEERGRHESVDRQQHVDRSRRSL